MNEKEFNDIFSKNLKYYMTEKNISQNELARYLNVSPTSVNNWYNGYKTPRMDKIDKLCEFFNINRSDLMTDFRSDEPDIEDSYYLDDDAKDLAEFMLENPEYKVLFDASRNVSKEDIEFVKEMIDRMSGNDGD